MRSLTLVSPIVLVAVTWGTAAVVTRRVLDDPEGFDLTHHFIAQHHLDPAAFSRGPIFWTVIFWLVFAVGYWAGGMVRMAERPPGGDQVDLERAARVLWRVNAVLVAVTALWVGISVQELGGPAAFVAFVQTDAMAARDVLLDNKLFTGMRLFYAALPATGAIAAAILAQGVGRGLSGPARARCIGVLVLAGVILLVLPIVMSQRLMLLQLVVAVFVAAAMARGRIVMPWALPFALGLFYLGWVLHEAITNPDIARGATDIATQKLAFYVVNDLWNSLQPLTGDVPRTYGLFSFQFAMFFTLTDGHFYSLAADRIAALEAFRGGGEFTMVSAPIVDFGLIGAALYLLVLGGIARLVFRLGQDRLMWGTIYAQFATAFVLSIHANFTGSQDFVFALLVSFYVFMRAGQVTVAAVGAKDGPVARHA